MKNIGVLFLAGVFLTFGLTSGLQAQEKTKKETKKESKMVIKVVKDGNTVMDTTMEVTGDFDQGMIDKMIKKYAGDEVSVNIMKADKMAVKMSHDEDCEGEEHNVMLTIVGDDKDLDKDINVKVEVDSDGKYTWTTSDEKGGHQVFKIKSEDGDQIIKEGKVLVIKKNEDGEEAIIEILSEDNDLEEILKKEHHAMLGDHHNLKVGKKGDVMFFGDEGEKHGVKVIKKDNGMVWVSDEDEDFELSSGHGDPHGNMAFFSAKPQKEHAIQLKPLENGQYRLEVNTDDLEPVVIEVFNATGERLYKKKVRHYYGRFLQEINLSDNESAFYTVKVTQGEREIIGEFEFK